MTVDDSSIQERAERALAPLVGLPLWAAGRAANVCWFHFGDRITQPAPRGGTREVGTFALHVSGTWRLAGRDGIITGSGDLVTPVDPAADPQTFDWSSRGANWCDHRLAAFMAAHEAAPPIVEEAHAGALGDARLVLASAIVLETFAHSSAAPHVETEFWRLFRPGMDQPHFVVDTNGAYSDG